MYDSLVSATQAANLTATANSPILDLGAQALGTSYKLGALLAMPLVLRLRYPATPTGTTPTAAAVLQESDDQSTWVNVGDVHAATSGTTNFPRIYRKRFSPSRRYQRVAYTVTGTTPDFGKPVVDIGIADNEIPLSMQVS